VTYFDSIIREPLRSHDEPGYGSSLVSNSGDLTFLDASLPLTDLGHCGAWLQLSNQVSSAPRSGPSFCAAANSSFGRVEDGRGSLGPMAITPFPIPAHRTGRAELPHQMCSSTYYAGNLHIRICEG
jgi:hypothetical protein